VRRRQEIIDGARTLLRERNADEFVVADVARVAGVSVATVYNLVGTRDRLLLAVLEEAVSKVDLAVGSHVDADPVKAVVDVVTTAVDVVMSDPLVHRRVLASLGRLTAGLWLDEGLERLLADRLAVCADAGMLRDDLPVDAVARSVQLGFRGAVMSWAVAELPAGEVRAEAELMACHVLANATTPEMVGALDQRIRDLSNRSAVCTAC
jgi:AcrR family transcriptional regulator